MTKTLGNNMNKRHYKSLVAAAIISSFSQIAIADTLDPILVDQDTWTNDTAAGVDTNYSSATVLRIDTPKMRAFMQFTVVDIPAGHEVDTATLTLTVNDNKFGNVPDAYIAPVNVASWDASTLTSANDTALTDAIGEPIDTATDIAVGSTVDFDLSSAISENGTYTFVLNINDKDARNTKFDSAETGDRAPKLTLTTKPSSVVPPPSVDTTKPVFPVDIEDVVINATTVTTDLNGDIDVVSGSLAISTTDDTDGVIAATIDSETSLTSGMHTVTLQATDTAGNKATKDVVVKIKPYLVITSPETTLLPAGSTTTAGIALSGPAIGYPATVDYTVTGDAASVTSGTLSFEDDASATKAQNVEITLLGSATNEQTAVLSLIQTTKVQTSSETVTITAFDGNTAPSVSLTLTQADVTLATINANNANEIPYIDATKGDVTVTVNVTDFNSEDTHAINWTNTSDSLTAESTESSFAFDPAELSGDFTLSVATTETNTADKFSSKTLTAQIRVIARELPELAADVDSDGDGIFDIDEGFKDSDGDGIVDYLDHAAVEVTQLPLTEGEKPLQTQEGLTLSLGSVSTSSQGIAAKSAVITLDDLAARYADQDIADTGFAPIEGSSLLNFTLDGLANNGDVASVVYPLPEGILLTAETEYRKYTPALGWTKFSSDDVNKIASAEKDAEGNCPAPTSELYLDGLTVGDSCIQLTIADGGQYDADGEANGSIEDPGVLAEAYTVIAWNTDNIALATTNVNEGSAVTLTKDLSEYLGDIDVSKLTFSVEDDASWLTIDEAGKLSVDVSKLITGDYSARVSFNDDKAQTGETKVSVSVAYNHAPKLSAIELNPAARNVAYRENIARGITDAESDAYTIEKISGPYWLKVAEGGILSGTPLKANIGDNNITVKLTDEKGATSQVSFNVPVTDSEVRASEGGSFSAGLISLLGLLTLRRKKAKK